MQTAQTRLRRGAVRNDGKVFWSYAKGRELWLSAEDFKRFRLRAANYQKNHNRKNGDRVREIEKACYYKNREARLAYAKEYRKNNADKIKAYSQKYARQRPEVIYSNVALRRARKKAALPKNANLRLIKTFYDQANRLTAAWSAKHIDPAFRVAFHVDHIIPLSRGGLHDASNLQVVPARWNLRKNNDCDFRLPPAYANAVQAVVPNN